MTSIYLENGGLLGVYGDVEIQPEQHSITVNIRGSVVKAEPPGTMSALASTSAVTVCTDQFPGKVLWSMNSHSPIEETELVQIPKGLHTLWVLSKEDGDVAKS